MQHVVAEKKDNFKAASFAEGHYLHVELAGMTRVAKRPNLARKFMTFILGRVPIGNAGDWMIPAMVPASGLPAPFKDVVKPVDLSVAGGSADRRALSISS